MTEIARISATVQLHPINSTLGLHLAEKQLCWQFPELIIKCMVGWRIREGNFVSTWYMHAATGEGDLTCNGMRFTKNE